MTFLFIYVLLTPLLMLWCRNDKKKQYLPLFFLFVISAIRYDTTSDYYNYFIMYDNAIYNMISDKAKIEYGYTFLNRIFSSFENGFIYVFAVCSTIIYTSFYLFFKKYSVPIIGTFVFLCLGCMYNFDNIVRQAVAIAFFNFAILSILKHKLYLAGVLIFVASTFHTSALVTIVLIILMPIFKHKVLEKNKLIFIVILLLLLDFIGAFSFIIDSFFSLSFITDSLYEHYDEYEFKKRTIGLAFIIMTIIEIAPVYMLDKENDKFKILCINMSWFSIVLRIIFAGIPFFYRIADYMIIFNILSVSFFLKERINVKNWKYYSKVVIVSLLYLLLFHSVSTYFGYTSIYYTVFSENCKNRLFYVRSTFDELQTKGINNERKKFFKY
ncbi:EpsG family protein [Prevotella sp. SGI.167]|uniref:EpsG family protein n=1 Tax=Prevotella sp. SGI.167 TaxID=3420566 RepID=UPI00404094AE